MKKKDILKEIEDKYTRLGEDPDTHLKGLLYSKPLNYWDYIQVETLLSLQKTRTAFKDEEVFIIYSQITELLLKSILIELKQVTGEHEPSEKELIGKLERINGYARLLVSFFQMMKGGMDYEQYSKFRMTLTPATGFQCVQFRYLELYSTRLKNLVKNDVSPDSSVEKYFEKIYWKYAGTDKKTGKKTLSLIQFEDKYLDDLVAFARKIRGKTLEDKVLSFSGLSDELVEKLKEYDRLINKEWPRVHLNTARKYLEEKFYSNKGTGGSEWQKYLDPDYQERIFFPQLYKAASENIVNHKVKHS